MRHLMFLLALLLVFAVVHATEPPAGRITYFDSTRVDAAFAKGMPLIETSHFKIHASRREAPGMAEIHERDTDIVHVLEGSAMLVTGGTATAPHTIAPEEIRGAAIAGGERRRIARGDVVVIPAGVPHQFLDVQAPLLYYVVKVGSSR
ncbi:MAG: cupin domain-containing protein [Bryobacteraceae bacterium]